jgi:hypothetical protein
MVKPRADLWVRPTALGALLCCAVWLASSRLASAQTPQPPAAGARAALPTDAELEAAGAVIGQIYFEIADIFNEDDPREDKSLYRLANKLHIKTRESTVQAQLLFRSGDPYSARLLAETERALRSVDYLHDAFIRPIAFDGKHVDILVQTRDVWTLNPGISFEHKGGESSASVEIEEENLLGYGKNIQVSLSQDVERRALLFEWQDPNVWQSRWRSQLAYSINDDGRLRYIDLERPFYALDTPWSTGGTVFDFTRVDPRYDLGEIVDEFRHDESFGELRGGWSEGLKDGWTTRWLAGFRYDNNTFAIEPDRAPPAELPPDRKLVYPWAGVAWLEDDYVTTRNLDKIGRVEDVHFGVAATLQLGWATTGLGSDRDAVIAAAAVRTAQAFNDRNWLFLEGNLSGRLESGEIADGLVDGVARYYWRQNDSRVFYVRAEGTTSQALDPEDQIQIGGDSGLRGYPLRYQTGTSRALVTLEQRFYTDWFPFRLFYVGGAVFFDAGRTWGRGAVGSESLGWLKDIGMGLRLGNARGAFGSVLHFDIAFPLDRTDDIDSVQFLVETKQSF